jgi:uncharacterized membrane protein YagU involved in acid resistance
MKKIHHKSLKFHTMYSIVISVIFLVIITSVRDITLGAAMIFLLLYIIGNGIIHIKNNELTRDTLIEYLLVSTIVLVIIFSATR